LSQEDEKKRFWRVDPAIFKLGRKPGSLERYLLPVVRVFGKYMLYALALSYPLTLALVGLVYGGLVFWGYFAGSIAVIGLVISRLGYARNFDRWDVGVRRFATIFVAFIAALGFFAGVIYLKIWLVPIVFAVLVPSLFLTLERSRLWHLTLRFVHLLLKRFRRSRPSSRC
jgi:hypothetical protein